MGVSNHVAGKGGKENYLIIHLDCKRCATAVVIASFSMLGSLPSKPSSWTEETTLLFVTSLQFAYFCSLTYYHVAICVFGHDQVASSVTVHKLLAATFFASITSLSTCPLSSFSSPPHNCIFHYTLNSVSFRYIVYLTLQFYKYLQWSFCFSPVVLLLPYQMSLVVESG
jgi:hypothetical protein